MRGAGALILIGAIVITGLVGLFVGHKTSGKPTAEGKRVAKLQQTIDTTEHKIDAEDASQGKVGQQFVAVTGNALESASAEAKADPAVQLATKSNARAAQALAHAMQPLTPEQAAWANQLVVDALSPEIARRAKAEASLVTKDAELQKSVANEAALKGKIQTLTDAKREADQDLIDHDASASAFRAKVWLIVAVVVGGYIGINYLLPLLVKSFPDLSGVANAAHAVWSGLWAKTLSESKALARDASGALHDAVKMVEAKEPPDAIKAEIAKWITPADGTNLRYNEALKDANVL